MNSSDTNKYATELVLQQIAIYDQQIENLRAEIRNAEARLQAVTMMRGAMEALVNSVAAPASSSVPPANNPVAELPVIIKPPTGAIGINGSAAGGKVGTAVTGFADAVRTILKDHPKGIKPSVLAKQMQIRGTAALYTGKAHFSVRVGSELHRLRKSGKVDRRNGRYYLVQAEQHP